MPDLEDRLARHQQFWGPKFDGEGPYFAAASHFSQFRSYEDRVNFWLDIDYRASVIEESFERAFFLGDAVPRVDPDFGPTFLPALLGRPYSIGEETVWFDIEPFEEGDEIYGLSLLKESPYYKTFIGLTKRLCEMSEGRFLVGVTDVGSEIDILASLYNRESLLIDTALAPQKVNRMLERVGEWWAEATLENERVIRESQPYTITWVPLANSNTWAPLLSELSAMVSGQTFDEIIAPSIERMSRIFDQILFNVDGDSYIRHLERVLALSKLHSIEWDPNPKYSASGKLEKDFTTPESIEVIRQILREKKLIFNNIPAWQVPEVMRQIPHDG
ncbi:MAG: hypothetical protein LBQ36_10140, partial [Synergistaceae bacterium]|nr:hypothetical protein [Synergistaceae bacterium]